jgi:hypothetical protein
MAFLLASQTKWGQSIWDKMKCYWEQHVEKHMNNLKDTLITNLLRILWEHIKNLLGTTINPTPPTFPKREKIESLRWMLVHPIRC